MLEHAPRVAGDDTEYESSWEIRFAAFRERHIKILEHLARGATLKDTLEAVVQMIEEQCPGSSASILLLDSDGQTLRHGAGASLPPEYSRQIDGTRIGPRTGSCGTAAYLGLRVIVNDIANDPLWADYKHIALPHGLRACWSEPIVNSEGKVTGTFAIYHDRVMSGPGEEDLQVIQVAAHLAGIALDHHQREQARKAEEKQKEALERKLLETQKLESLGVLAGGIAHDFNNLLTGVLGNATLMRLQLKEWPAMLELLGSIEDASLRAADLCKQMLAYAGKGRFVLQTLDLSTLIHDSIRLLQVSVGKNAQMHFDLEQELPAIEGDPTQLRQILMNLVINASEALGTRNGEITVSTGRMTADRATLDRTYLSPELPEGEYVYLEVSDNGEGMSGETMARIFEPFFTTKFTGRGLGLAAVIGIVRGHRGALKVHSEPGEGSTFKLLLPAVQGAELSAETPIAATATGNGGGRILIVDDEEIVRSVSMRILKAHGFEPLVARDGREGLEIFRGMQGKIRAVVLDLTMPHMDGETAFRELRLIDPTIQILLMSGFNEQEAVSRFAGKGLAGFIQKPFTPDALIRKLGEVLENSTGAAASRT